MISGVGAGLSSLQETEKIDIRISSEGIKKIFFVVVLAECLTTEGAEKAQRSQRYKIQSDRTLWSLCLLCELCGLRYFIIIDTPLQ
jgi:hypothetical protein